MIEVTDRGKPLTVVAFSGLAPDNHVYEWTKSFADLPVNLIGVKDPHNAWWQIERRQIREEVDKAILKLRAPWIAIGGSAGGFGAIMFGRQLAARKIIAFVPQTACGATKRALGDWRWANFCLETPENDLAGWGENVEIHVGEDPHDIIHADRMPEAKIVRYARSGHDLPHDLKNDGRLKPLLESFLERETA